MSTCAALRNSHVIPPWLKINRQKEETIFLPITGTHLPWRARKHEVECSAPVKSSSSTSTATKAGQKGPKTNKFTFLLLKMLYFRRMAAVLFSPLFLLQPSKLLRAFVLNEILNYALAASFRAIKLSHVASCPMSLPKLRVFQHHLLNSFYMMLT